MYKKMCKKMLLVTIFLGSSVTLMSQTVQGIVVDAADAPLSFVNVIELSKVDSSFVSGTVSQDDGTFKLNNVKTGNILKVSCVGYETQCVSYTGQASITFKLQGSNALLGEVVVKSHLPKTILSGEGMATTVAGSILEKENSVQ